MRRKNIGGSIWGGYHDFSGQRVQSRDETINRELEATFRKKKQANQFQQKMQQDELHTG